MYNSLSKIYIQRTRINQQGTGRVGLALTHLPSPVGGRSKFKIRRKKNANACTHERIKHGARHTSLLLLSFFFHIKQLIYINV